MERKNNVVALEESGDGGGGRTNFPNSMLRINTPGENSPFPLFGKPLVVGCFSLKSDREYVEGPEYLKFLKLPTELDKVRYDLEELNRISSKGIQLGEDMFKQTNELVHLLYWIHNAGEQFTGKPNFVFYRGLMTKILGTPYEAREGWKLGALFKNGTIYLRNVETEESIKDRLRQSSDQTQKRMASWGYNFEQFLLSDSPHLDPNPTEVVKNECNLVFRTKLGTHTLLYAAEIDGVWLPSGSDMNPKLDPESLSKCNLIELKTTRLFPNNQMTHNFRRFNLRKWFCQSFTVGVSHVIAGLRDDEGIVRSLRIFPTKELSDLGEDWSSNVCFKFLEIFLSHVKEIVNGEEGLVFVFAYDPLTSNAHSKTIRVTTEKADESNLYLPNIK